MSSSHNALPYIFPCFSRNIPLFPWYFPTQLKLPLRIWQGFACGNRTKKYSRDCRLLQGSITNNQKIPDTATIREALLGSSIPPFLFCQGQSILCVLSPFCVISRQRSRWISCGGRVTSDLLIMIIIFSIMVMKIIPIIIVIIVFIVSWISVTISSPYSVVWSRRYIHCMYIYLYLYTPAVIGRPSKNRVRVCLSRSGTMALW